MSDRYLPLGLHALRVGQVLPVDVWNDRGVLLLSKGHAIESPRHVQMLALHRPMVRESDWLRLRDQGAGAGLLRAGVESTLAGLASTLKRESVLPPTVSDDPAIAWPEIQLEHKRLMRDPLGIPDFVDRLHLLTLRLQELADGSTDDTLFLLMQMLLTRDGSYSSTHALMTAVIGHLLAPQLVDAVEDRMSLVQAALTMNIAMAGLQDRLSEHQGPLSTDERERVRAHPRLGHDLLSRCGVTDATWLELVLDHHERLDGQGYSSGKTDLSTLQQMLHLSDQLVARFSPRAHRPGLPPLLAMRQLYQEVESHPQAKRMGELFIRELGLYPPGTYVKIASGETVIVRRRGSRANTPFALVLLNRQGLAVGIPAPRDTSQPAYAVQSPVSPAQVPVRLDPARVLKLA